MKKFLAVFLGAVILLSGCSAQPATSQDSGTQAYTFTDALGHDISVSEPETIVSLLGSFSEAWALAGGTLAGVTQDAFDENRIEPDGKIVNLGSLQSPSTENILALDPDLVILSANTSEQLELYDMLSSAGIAAAYFDVETFDDYLEMMKIFTDITGREDLYQKNGLDIQAQIDGAIAKSSGQPSPKVLFIRAFSTGAKAKNSDSMTGAMLKDLSCVNIADTEKSLLEDLSMEVIIKEDPDYIFVTTMGQSSEKALEALKESVQSNPAWNELSAVKSGRYIVLPKELFHLKPNARWGESYETLADILYG